MYQNCGIENLKVSLIGNLKCLHLEGTVNDTFRVFILNFACPNCRNLFNQAY